MSLEKNIKLKVTAETNDAESKLDKLNNSVEDLGTKAKDTAPAMDNLDKAIAEYRNKNKEASKATEELSSNTNILGNFMSVALAGGVLIAGNALFNFLASTFETNGAVENLTATVKEHWTETYKATQEWERFDEEIKKFKADELQASIDGINLQLLKLQATMNMNVSTKFLKVIGWYTDEINLLSEAMGKLNKETQRQNAMNFMKGQLGWDWDEFNNSGIFDKGSFWDKKEKNNKKVIDEETKFYNQLKKLDNDYIKWLQQSEKNLSSHYLAPGARSNITGGKGKIKGGKDEADMTNEFKSQLEFMENLNQATVETMRGEFHTLWEDVFGEANSFVEKLGENILSMFAQLGTQSLVKGLFGLISGIFTGGAATAVTAIPSLFSGSNSPNYNGSNGQTIVLQMDNQTMATWYVGGKNTASRLRMD